MTSRRSLLSFEEGTDTLSEPTFGRDEDCAEAAHEEPAYREPEYGEGGWTEEAPSAPRGVWVTPAIAIAVILGWTGFFGWVHGPQMLTGATPEAWTGWIANWSMPVLLVIGVWLLAMRNSRREANRFTDAARALAKESSLLEARLTVVNRELSLAREFIAAQSRDLESLGRVASERLSENADRLQGLIRDNSAQVETIGQVSTGALANMESLRDQLPVLTNAARDMSNQIGNAGNVAHQQIDGLVDGFARLNEFGEAGQKHVEQIGDKVRATLDSFDRQIETLGEVTQARFGKLREVSEAFRTDMVESEDAAFASLRLRADELASTLSVRMAGQREAEQEALSALQVRLEMLSSDGETLLSRLQDGHESARTAWSAAVAALEARMADALAEIARADEAGLSSARHRLTLISQEAGEAEARIAGSLASFDADIVERRAAIRHNEERELSELEARIAAFEKRLAQRREDYVALVEELAKRSEGLYERLSEIDADMRRIACEGDDARTGLGMAAQEFAERLELSRAALEENSAHVARLTDDGVRLLEIIRASAEHSQGSLAQAIGSAEARLSNFADEATRLASVVADAESHGAALAMHVGSAEQGSVSAIGHLRALENQIAVLNDETGKLAERTGDELRNAIEVLSGSATQALAGLRDNQREMVEEIAGTIAGQSRERVAEAIREDAAAAIAELEAAAAQAAERGRRTTVALRDQLAKVNELTGNLESRIAYARERTEERIDTDFSRRIALITESLNSSSIDISKAFDNEVSDTQWAHYLRGDRGIFTRRAVRLLNRQESRAVVEIYGEDAEFRETVNRFIHDFEAMLREVLSTRDGNALAVTLLSSDAGKLYVALAQAIDRLRT
ncbi:MAG: ATPase [Erythrobacter sp.]|nr:MAG: ATPase [Erythrobacter sp.]